jgi:dihydrodipicolinate synthase/N-acetylneuraminate lyase
MNAPPLRGVFPVFQTPFTADESIAFDQLEREIDWVTQQGVSGIVFGMVSEILRLTDAERKSVIGTAARVAGDAGLPCIASVGSESTKSALCRIDDAIDAGASALMATPPLHGRHDNVQLEAYFRALLNHSPVPMVVQDASGYVGQQLSIEMQSRLFYEFGDLVMFKPEAVPVRPSMERLLDATGGGARIFEGMGGGALMETYALGITGSMPGAEVCWAVIAMWNALEEDDARKAGDIHEPLARMLAMQGDLDSFVVCEKYLLVEQRVLADTTARTPLDFSLTDADRKTLSALLNELHGLVFGSPLAVLSH